LVPSAGYFDMPSLLSAAIAEREHVRTHPIEGYWLDVGRLADYERANVDFDEVFS
jgi:NDP-sugar pyrophosphorylase family protein